MILLDTNALIWVATGHRRSRSLLKQRARLCVSPASLLELQIAVESGYITLPQPIEMALQDERWLVDDPPASAWFLQAAEVSWTRDPFDRLLVAHAHLRRWRLATGDARIIEQLGSAAMEF